MASKVQIINMALRSLGADPIVTVTEDSENARKANSVYDICLESLLRAHPWSFAKKESVLSQSSSSPVLSDYTYIYNLPSDYLKLLKTSVEPEYSHKIKGRSIYSNSNTLSIEYIYLCEDPSLYDSSFVDALAARLAAELVFAITGKANMIEFKWKEFKEKLNIAKSNNGQEVTPDESTCDTWLNSRV